MKLENVAPIDRPIMLECPPVDLCSRRYPGHTKGCPNHGKRDTCPPQANIWTPEFINSKLWVAVWNKFDFGAHVEKMRVAHPKWTDRQCANCLYWQGTARKRLRERVAQYFHSVAPRIPLVYYIPEAHGVNVTATMKEKLGIELEWPPKTVTYQVALIGEDACTEKAKA